MFSLVEPMKIKPGMSTSSLIDEFERCRVLGAYRIAKAVELVVKMFKDPECKIFLGIAGPIVPGGLRKAISDLIKRKYVDAIVSSGANIVHDLIEAIGYRHFKGSSRADDVALRRRRIGRIGDVYVKQSAFEALERTTRELIDEILSLRGGKLSISDLLHEVGTRLEDRHSILANASKARVPIYCPGLIDSMMAFHLWTLNQVKKLDFDFISDFGELVEIALSSKKTGAIILGGGLPKHHILAANMLRGGLDFAVQITLDRPEGGSLSGAPLEEAISWRKIKTSGDFVTIIGDATVIFPLVIAGALSKINNVD